MLLFSAFVLATSADRACNEEMNRADGKDYEGCQQRTVNGNTCQDWDAQEPHEHLTWNTPKTTGPEAGLLKNYCRNPDSEKGIWCYTTNPRVRWEFCAPLKSTPHCLKVVTGSGSNEDGRLYLTVDTGNGPVLLTPPENEGDNRGPYFQKGATVVEKCYVNGIKNIEVWNNSGDAWAGTIQVALDSAADYAYVACGHNCVLPPNYEGNLIAVDGDDNWNYLTQPAAKCSSGNHCTMDIVGDCDCSYHFGPNVTGSGCYIKSTSLKSGWACKCAYRSFLWTCTRDVERCSTEGTYGDACENPSTSLESCKAGGGDCDGYRWL